MFSDYAKTFLGERLLDALELVDPDIVANNHDFDLYRRIKLYRRAVLSQNELSGNQSQHPSGTGNNGDPRVEAGQVEVRPDGEQDVLRMP